MLITNQTNTDYWFGPLHLPAGVGQQITVDDTSATSLYLTNDQVADAINNLYISAKITVASAAAPFPRPTGVPSLLHGDGAPEGLVYAPQGSVYMRRDGTQTNGGVLYLKTTGVTLNTGWLDLATATGVAVASPTGTLVAYAGSSAPTGWLICDGSAISRSTYSTLFGVISTTYGAGDGSTTFNLPDLRGRVAVGYAASGGHADVSTLGVNDGQAVANRRPKHRTSDNKTVGIGTLGVSDPGHNHGGATGTSSRMLAGNNDGGANNITQTGTGTATLPTLPISTGTTGISLTGAPSLGGSIGTNNANDALDTPSYIVLNHIIKT
jgi:microcystin-dependent protein